MAVKRRTNTSTIRSAMVIGYRLAQGAVSLGDLACLISGIDPYTWRGMDAAGHKPWIDRARNYISYGGCDGSGRGLAIAEYKEKGRIILEVIGGI